MRPRHLKRKKKTLPRKFSTIKFEISWLSKHYPPLHRCVRYPGTHLTVRVTILMALLPFSACWSRMSACVTNAVTCRREIKDRGCLLKLFERRHKCCHCRLNSLLLMPRWSEWHTPWGLTVAFWCSSHRSWRWWWWGRSPAAGGLWRSSARPPAGSVCPTVGSKVTEVRPLLF